MELAFWIPILCRIPDSLSCIPGSKTQDSRFHKHKFSRIPESGFPHGSYLKTTPLQKYLLLNLSFVCFLQDVSLACFTCSRFLNFYKSNLDPCKKVKIWIPGSWNFSFGIWNPGNLCLLDPKFWTLESAVRVKESAIPLTIGIPSPSSTDKESRIQYLESGIGAVWSLECSFELP